MHPMRLAKRQITDPEALRRVVEEAQVLRIGATDEEGMFIVPVNYGYRWEEGEGGQVALSFYLHSAREGRKARAFRAGGAAGTPVAIELDVDGGNITGPYACAFSRAYRSIMGTGRVLEVGDEAERMRGLELLMEHAAPGAPAAFAREAIARVAIFRIDVEAFTGKERASHAG